LSLLFEISRLDAMGFWQVPIDFKCALGGRECILISPINEPQFELRKRHQRPCFCVIGIEQCSLAAEANDRFFTRRIPRGTANPLLSSHEIKIIRVYIRSAAVLYRALLHGKQLYLEGIYNRL